MVDFNAKKNVEDVYSGQPKKKKPKVFFFFFLCCGFVFVTLALSRASWERAEQW